VKTPPPGGVFFWGARRRHPKAPPYDLGVTCGRRPVGFSVEPGMGPLEVRDGCFRFPRFPVFVP